jgi:tetratricopeptide (TPR) repeat protein
LKLAESLGEGGLAEVAASLNVLGEVYFEMKDLKMAQAVFQRALALRVRTLGRNHPEVAECLHNIEASLDPMPLDEETRKKCRALSTSALRIRVKAYGRKHPLVALNLRALAKIHLALHDHTKSLSCARNVADIYEKTLGESHRATQAARNYISIVQADLDELEEMIRLEKENPLAPDDVAGQIYRWSSRSPRLNKGQDGE